MSIFRCYKCDDEVQLEQSKRLQECLDIIRKQAGLPQAEPGQYMSLNDMGVKEGQCGWQN